jgi:hypothetical protein
MAKLQAADKNPVAAVLTSVRLCIYGLLGFISTIWVSLPIMWSCPGAFVHTAKGLAANAVFVWCFRSLAFDCIGPMSTLLEAAPGAGPLGALQYMSANGALFMPVLLPLLWLLPGFLMGMLKGAGYNQDLADDLYRQRMGLAKDAVVKKKASPEDFSADLVWLLMMVQIKLLWDTVPDMISAATLRVFTMAVGVFPGAQAVLLPMHSYIYDAIFYATRTIAIIFQASIYSMFPFECVWKSWGAGAAERCRTIEVRWEYFVGFSLPLVYLARTMGFFEYYALFLGTFPLVVAGAAAHDYNEGYAVLTGDCDEHFTNPEQEANMHMMLGAGPVAAGKIQRTTRRSTASRGPNAGANRLADSSMAYAIAIRSAGIISSGHSAVFGSKAVEKVVPATRGRQRNVSPAADKKSPSKSPSKAKAGGASVEPPVARTRRTPSKARSKSRGAKKTN